MFLFKKKKDKSDIPKTEPIQGSKLAVEVEFADGSTAMLGGFGDITIGSGETCDCTLQGEDIFESHCRILPCPTDIT